MLTVRHKRGATLSYSGAITDDAGDAVDLTGYTLTSEVRSADRELVSTATITVATPSSGLFTVEVSATDTAGWTAGARLLFDVRVQSASARVDYTETIAIDVVERQTDP